MVEQLPMRRQIEYHASNRYGSEPVSHRLSLPYVIFVVSTADSRIDRKALSVRRRAIPQHRIPRSDRRAAAAGIERGTVRPLRHAHLWGS